MTTSELVREQHLFMLDLSMLMVYIDKMGYFISPGELRRWPEMQKIYVETGRSWTNNSRHLDGLAIDITLFKWNGSKMELATREEYKEFGDYWETISGSNIHGLRAGWDNKDVYHFERKVSL